VVLATGAYSPELYRKLGLDLPLQPAKGYHCDRTPREGETPALRTTCMLGERSVFCTPMDGFLRFAGTLEFSGVNHDLRRSRLEQLTRSAEQYLEGVGEAQSLSEWCGLRPCMADGLPAVGPVPGYAGAFIATGHAMLGLTLGPVTGKLMSEFVLDGKVSLDTSALGPDRF
jgi:D-amino-acid dehydrogenase